MSCELVPAFRCWVFLSEEEHERDWNSRWAETQPNSTIPPFPTTTMRCVAKEISLMTGRMLMWTVQSVQSLSLRSTAATEGRTP